jgi:methionyl-tRNA synthetase
MMKNNRKDEAMALVALIVNIMAKVTILLDSVMPHKTKQIALSLGIDINTQTYQDLIVNKGLIENTIITKIDALFPKIEEPLLKNDDTNEIQKQEKNKKEGNLITIDQFFQTELKIGTIVEAFEVPKSKKLLKLRVDVGEKNPRQIVAGIKEFYNTQELVGTQACVVTNLKPAKLMGLKSEGMLLASKDENGLSLLRPETKKISGSKVS